MLLNCGVGEDSWESLGLQGDFLKEISPEYSLEELMLKLQYFDHLMWKADSSEKSLMLRKSEGKKKRGWQRMRWLDGITDSMDVSLSSSRWWGTGKPGVLQFVGLHRVRHDLRTKWQQRYQLHLTYTKLGLVLNYIAFDCSVYSSINSTLFFK